MLVSFPNGQNEAINDRNDANNDKYLAINLQNDVFSRQYGPNNG